LLILKIKKNKKTVAPFYCLLVNSECSSHETDATPKNASDLVSDDEHGEQLVRPKRMF
jgi:hypothetical protein